MALCTETSGWILKKQVLSGCRLAHYLAGCIGRDARSQINVCGL